MEFLNKLSVILPGIIIGVILFQTIVVAPTVFKSLGAELASPFLRAIFHGFFSLWRFVVLRLALRDFSQIMS